jgi:ubiquinone/menaquinone biosynthesis C-methylase UbiE
MAAEPGENSGSTFNAQNADAYDQMMGRWSRRLAPLLIQFGGIADGDRVLDVGCGSGSLTFALPAAANVSSVTAIDYAQAYVNFVHTHNADPRISVQQADACALPFDDNAFDRAYSMLVLHFVSDAERAIAEMCRVVRPGGVVSAAVWDNFSGLPFARIVSDIAAVLGLNTKSRPLLRSLDARGELAALWRRAGLLEVEQTSLLIYMEFSSFEDYWQPFTKGEGPIGHLVSSLNSEEQKLLQEHTQRAYLANQLDGPRSFAAIAWACRGIVPSQSDLG